MESDAMKEPLVPEIRYDNAKAMMARGSLELHNHMASLAQKALGRSFPQIDVRFENLSITAEVAVDGTGSRTELPTLANEMKKTLRSVFAKKRTVKKEILKNMSGVFKPGTITLVLGQPGSGKSSLMKVLSGRFPEAKNVLVEGEVTYNGTPSAEMKQLMPQLVSYVEQRDHHSPLLTVKETMEFAHASSIGDRAKREGDDFARSTLDESGEALKMYQAVMKHYPEVIVQQLGLDGCQNTIVGDAMVRGVSGGERKRVTTGEMAFGNRYIMMMDEITTGLDSAAAYDIIETQRSFARTFNATVVISLLQPSPEIFELFDNVMILNDGYVVYHGPRGKTLEYFESLGFLRPPSRDVADFLLDLGTDLQHSYEVDNGSGCSTPRTPKQFSETFERSPIHAQMLADLEEPISTTLLQSMEIFLESQPEFDQSIWASTSLLLKREITILKREASGLIGRFIMNTVVALLYSAVFYQIDPTDPQLLMGVIFEAVLCLSLAQAAQIPTIMAAREVFYKQRGANFFRTAPYVLSHSLSQILPIVFESVVFGSIVYWMCGLVGTFAGFITFLVILCVTNITFQAFFFLLASASPNLNMANPISSVCVLFFTLYAGFSITKGQIPDYLVWIYWINPVAWAVRALAVNQYSDSSFDTCVYEGVDYCNTYGMTMGEYSLSLYEVPSEKFWVWSGVAYMAATYVLFIFLACIALEYHRYEAPENVTLDRTDFADEGAEEYTAIRTPRNTSPRSEAVVTVIPADRHFIPVTLAFRDLWYSVPDPTNSKQNIDLLKGISGYALPGTMTALMGSSGAGKTTLMDVIAGRKTGGKLEGQILLNGHPATDLSIRRATGYCEQMDIHWEAATIRESLTFSAFLRQNANISDDEKRASVDECLDLLGLTPIADQIVRGSSVEQMKRLTIGVELAAQPSVLFLDEPTSGLDARSAKLIMDGVREVADTGRTIVCTIHQPSWEVFQVFDNLLLLKRGGEMVFQGDLGENAGKMIKYFQSIDGVDKLPHDYNPATWMLEVIGAGIGNKNAIGIDFVEIFRASTNFELLQAKMNEDGVFKPSPLVPALDFGEKRAATELTQMTFLLSRFWHMYWRTPSFNFTRLAISLWLGFAFGITYVGAEYSSYSGINSGLGMLYMAMAFLGLVSFNGIIPVAGAARVVFYRERAAQTYNAFWYFFASTIVEIPYAIISSLLFMAVLFPMAGFSGVTAFCIVSLILVLSVLLLAYIGEFLVFLAPNLEVAEILGMLLTLILFLFMGFSPPASTLASGCKWVYHINPLNYMFSAASAVVFANCDDGGESNNLGCRQMTNAPSTLPDGTTVKEYLQVNFSVEYSELWRNVGILSAFVVVVCALKLLAMRFVNHQKK